jgi:tetratricopeptide (TPR) repeat protein
MQKLSTAVLALLMLFPGPAMGQVSPQEGAKTLYRAGSRAYKDGQFRRAARFFERAYALDNRPAFLLNVAQCYRQAKLPKKALVNLELFLEVAPNSPMAAQVRVLMTRLREQIKKQEEMLARATKPSPKLQAPKKNVVAVKKPVTVERPFYKKWWFWTAIGAAVVAASVTTAVVASSGDSYTKEGGLGSVAW